MARSLFTDPHPLNRKPRLMHQLTAFLVERYTPFRVVAWEQGRIEWLTHPDQVRLRKREFDDAFASGYQFAMSRPKESA